jgi:prevent-host-death family protein
MPRTVSASEAKAHFGSIVDWALDHEDEVIVESHGQPKVTIVPFEEYRKMAHCGRLPAARKP